MSEAHDTACDDLVSANHILGREGVLSAYGHVSVRDPDDPGRFHLSRARAPGLVEQGDLLDFDLEGRQSVADPPALYIERFIHAAVYEARPDVNAVCHNHAPELLPFSISRSVPLRGVIHSAGFLGSAVPVWDIADEFGTGTDLLVRTVDQGRSLARALGSGGVALMRGHGSVVAAGDVRRLVSMCVGVVTNARVQLGALTMGEFQPLHDGEASARSERPAADRPPDDGRAWEYYLQRAGR